MGARQLKLAADVATASRVRPLRRRGRAPRGVRRVALVGAPSDVRALRQQLVARDPHDFALVGAVSAGVRHAERYGDGLRWLGTLHELRRLLRTHRITELVLVPGAAGAAPLLDGVLRASAGVADLRVALVPTVHELRIGRVATRTLADVPLLDVVPDPPHAASLRVKHALAHLLATVLLVLVLPLLLGAALAVRLGSRGPVLFRQRRVGRDGREFVIYKLRTMRDDAERGTGPVLAQDADARVTGVGRVLRATRLDELPQLLNVLNGTMSLIGPRPERPEFADRLLRDVPGYRERWLVKPGLTGLAQVRGEYHTSPAGKLRHDLAYVHNRSVALDVKILAATVATLVARRGV